jgi:hypothetical protein
MNRDLFQNYRVNFGVLSKAVPIPPCRLQVGEKILLILDLATRWGERSVLHPNPGFPPEEMIPPPVPIGYESRWASELVWTQRLEEKSLVLVWDRTPSFQSVVRHYTD